ncbi:MAG: hypothetical protein WC644_02065 [Ignavibacteria bacterium]|jgi:hypothetical protein
MKHNEIFILFMYPAALSVLTIFTSLTAFAALAAFAALNAFRA